MRYPAQRMQIFVYLSFPWSGVKWFTLPQLIVAFQSDHFKLCEMIFDQYQGQRVAVIRFTFEMGTVPEEENFYWHECVLAKENTWRLCQGREEKDHKLKWQEAGF